MCIVYHLSIIYIWRTGYFAEYAGNVFEEMSMEGRMTVCNLSIEMGARGGMIARPENI
jgi:homoaconitase/3-isopropylmalate dehydratase large subunit